MSPRNIPPLEFKREGDLLRFSLLRQDDILPELPPDYELELAEQLADLLAEGPTLSAEIDLRDVPAISSRELGSIIALQRVLRPAVGPVRVVGVSSGVRHLLKLTRTDQLFDLPQ